MSLARSSIYNRWLVRILLRSGASAYQERDSREVSGSHGKPIVEEGFLDGGSSAVIQAELVGPCLASERAGPTRLGIIPTRVREIGVARAQSPPQGSVLTCTLATMPQVPTEPLEGVLRRLEAVYSKAENANPGVGDATSSRSRPALDESILPILAAICLIPHNDPDDFAVLFRYFAASLSTSCFSHSQNLATLAHFVLRLRTSLFKAVPLVGVPRIINALGSLHDAVVAHPFGTDILATLPGHSTKPANTAEEDSKAGWEFFEAIYAQHAEKIIERIGTTSPDLAEMIVDDLYGRNLSRREVLSWKETVLIEFTGW